MMMNYMGKNGLILGAFALITTGLIALTFTGTESRIKAAQEKQLLSVLNKLVPESQHTNELHLDCIIINDPLLGSSESKRIFRARNQSENVAAVLEATAPDGYSGEIKLVVAADTKGDSLGARVIKHNETPGLGDKIDIRVSDWILSFNDVPFEGEGDNRWQVKKDGGQFDQFTGATITPRAVVEAVKNALLFFKQNQANIFDTPSNCYSSKEQGGLSDE